MAVHDNADTLAEVPSAAWGWSGEYRRAYHVFGWIVVVVLLGMLKGNHRGHVEDVFLVGFALAIAAVLIRDILIRRKPH